VGLISSPLTRSLGLIVDTSEKLNAPKAKALRAAGVGAIGRYVFFGQPRPGDLDREELAVLTGEGHVVWVIQHPRDPADNMLSSDTGKADADWAITNAVSAGYDPSVISGPLSLTLDMEGLKNPGPASFAHANMWNGLVDFGIGGAGFRPLDYLGYDSGLTSANCDSMADELEFWLDDGPYSERPSPARKFAMRQGISKTIAGVGVDLNTLLKDGVIFGVAAG
jgi:hypothetical protein